MAGNPINVYISPKQKRMMKHNQDPYSDEIYHLPIVITAIFSDILLAIINIYFKEIKKYLKYNSNDRED